MKWEKVKIKDLAKPSNNKINVNPLSEYPLLGIRLWGEGCYARETIQGVNTQYKYFTIAKKGDLVVNKIWARNGSISVILSEFENYYISPEFPVYNLMNNVFPKWIYYYTKYYRFWKDCDDKSRGTSGKNRIKPSQFEGIEIPLPPLSEQKRIVAKLDAVKNKIDKIKKLRDEQEREIRNFQSSFFEDLLKTEKNISIGEILIPQRKNIELNPLEEYMQITVRMNHKGVDLRGYILGKDVGSNQFLASENDFIISKIDARNAAMGIVPKELHGAIVTNDFPLYKFTDEIKVKYFDYFSNTYYFDNACKNASEGTTNRRRLKKEKFENILIPKPSIKKQEEIIEELDKLNSIKSGHAQIQKELEELFPSLLDKAFKGELV